jgi:hypothetical protein
MEIRPVLREAPRGFVLDVDRWLVRLARRHRRRRSATWERHRCPRRGIHTAETDLQPDTWDRDLWHPDLWTRLERWWERVSGLSTRSRSRIHWPAGAASPRTCSRCGTAHPEDAIRFVHDHVGRGWRIQMGILSETRLFVPYDVVATREPVPAFRVSILHFTPDQVDRWNEAVRTSGAPPWVRLVQLTATGGRSRIVSESAT